MISQETVQLVRQAIDSLPEDQKKIVLLYQEELSYERIAEVLGCSVKAVERRLYRARKRLKKIILG
jgi:RNA polymerase sigma-70 factor (ECF subfamily)